MMETLEQRLQSAKTDTEAMNRLLLDYYPFICKEINRAGTFGLEYDERLSIAMLVFARCVVLFEPEKGNFFRYTASAIHNRLIDEGKRAFKQRQHMVYLESGTEDCEYAFVEGVAAGEVYRLERERERLSEEVHMFRLQLQELGIRLETLDACSPKQQRTRAQCLHAAIILSERPHLMRKLSKTKHLPITELALAAHLPVKFLGKYRRYIIALAIVHTDDYPKIKALIP